MKLSDFLAERNIKAVDFGPRIGVSPQAVRRYCLGERIPDRKTMARIFGATEGLVDANDFFGLKDSEHQPDESEPPHVQAAE
jgi:hypothetical protein